MDNVCHTLVGAAIGEAGLKRRSRYGTAALMVSANIPDVDVLVFFSDIAPVSFRRGWTHGVAAQLLLPCAVVGLFWVIDRVRRKPDAGVAPLHVGWLLLLAYAGVYSHVFLDLLNNYGIRLLAPFDWRWFYGDAVFIIDIWLWLMLGTGVYLARRQKRPIYARAALAFAACYIASMMLSARAAREVVAELWRETHGAAPRALMVGPVALTPVTRVVIIDAGDRYETGVFRWWPTGVVFDPTPIPKNDGHPAVARAVEQSRSVREFLVWSRFPFWRVERTPAGIEVSVGDARFTEATRAANATFIGRTLLPP